METELNPAPAQDLREVALKIWTAWKTKQCLDEECCIAVLEMGLAEYLEQQRQAAIVESEETFEESFPGGVAEFRRLEKAAAEKEAAERELLAACDLHVIRLNHSGYPDAANNFALVLRRYRAAKGGA